MFDYLKNNALWQWVVSCFASLKVYFSWAFLEAFAASPNFIVFVISLLLFLVGACLKKSIAKALCMFWGGLIAVFSLVEFALIRF